MSFSLGCILDQLSLAIPVKRRSLDNNVARLSGVKQDSSIATVLTFHHLLIFANNLPNNGWVMVMASEPHSS